MSIVRDQLFRVIHRARPRDFFPWLAVDEKKKLIFMERGYVGAILMCNTLYGADESVVQELSSALSIDFPAGTIIQAVNWNVPDSMDILERFLDRRRGNSDDKGLSDQQKTLINGTAENIHRYFEAAQNRNRVFQDSGVPLTKNLVFFAIKIPVAEFPTDDEIDMVDEKIGSFASTINMMSPYRVDHHIALSLWRRMLHLRHEWEEEFDENALLRDQITGPGDAIEDHESYLSVDHGDGEKDYISVLSIKEFSRPINMLATNFLMGDPLGRGTQLTLPAALVWTINIPDQVKKRRAITNESTLINWQSGKRMMSWSPKLRLKKEGIDFLMEAINTGDNALEMAFTALLWGPDAKTVKNASGSFISHAAKAGFVMLPDKQIALPMFLNAMPLFPDRESMAMTFRYKSVGTTHAVAACPVISDWQGNNMEDSRLSPACSGTLLVSRRGHLMVFDIFASNSGHNFVLAGMTRSGKSVTAQQLVMDQLSVGAQVWVIEVGRSFEKLCKLFGGDHIDLRPEMDVGLNPFTVVGVLDDEISELTAIIGTMISPRGELSDEDLSTVAMAIRSVYGKAGREATPTDVQAYLVAQDNNPRAIAMGKMMNEFTLNGAHGRWFNAPMNVSLNGSRFVNLELMELQRRPQVMLVVLMQMMFAIGKEISSATDKRRRILFVDEASVLLEIQTALDFLEGLARRVAKHQGALGIGIQALSDLYKNEKTRTISAQTAHFLVMRQNADSVAQLENNKQFVIGPSGLAMMKTVRKTKEYAETFLYSEESMAIGRLQLDPYRRVLFATDGPEKEEVVEAMRNGVDPDTAIRQFLAQHPEFSTGEYSGEDLDSEDAEEAEKGGKEVEYLGDIAGVAEDREDTEGAA